MAHYFVLHTPRYVYHSYVVKFMGALKFSFAEISLFNVHIYSIVEATSQRLP